MNWDRIAEESLAVTHEVLTALRQPAEECAAELARRVRDGGKILLCGNGGSAADAQHMAAELVNRFLVNRRPYAAVSLTTDTSILTSVGNDFGFDEAFAKQVLALGRPGDALVAFSTSGTSRNVCLALEAARTAGVWTLALTGGAGGRMPELADRCLTVAASSHTPRVQEGHHLLMHILCERIEEILG
ncbi:MAG: SIS domain-containing protein [Lentisphaerae bacterium]|nr:SIS domain-containing protein [Lentisphaerota bacterium]